MPKACNLCGLPAFVLSNGSSLALFVDGVIDWKGDKNETVIRE